MAIDSLLRLSTDQDISQVAGSYVSTNTIDLGVARDIGAGMTMHGHFVLTAALVGATATLRFEIISSAAASLTSPFILGQSRTYPVTSMTLGAQVVVKVNPDIADIGGMVQRYVGARYVIGTATTTAGTVTADLVLGYSDGRRFYASGFAV